MENKMSYIAAASTRQISVIKWNGKAVKSSKETVNEETLSKETLSGHVEPNSLKSPQCVVIKERKTENYYLCSFCKKSFKWRSHWKSHERIHTGERPFHCEICGKTFTRSDGLQCHKELHNINRLNSDLPQGRLATAQRSKLRFHEIQSSLPQCRLCSKKCHSFAGLMKHIQKHKGQTNYQCEICNKIFKKRSALEIHSRVHTGVKPYQCNICRKGFSIQGNLKRHSLIHSGERPFKCLICSSSFNNRSHLTRHIKKKHPAPAESQI